MSALSRVSQLTRSVREGRLKLPVTETPRAPRLRLSTDGDNRLTEASPRSDNRLRSENARKWLAAGSLDRDADDIAATVDRLVSALDSRDWMTSPSSPSKQLHAAPGLKDPAPSRTPADDLSFAEGVDFREVARRIAEFRQARPDPAVSERPDRRRAPAADESARAPAPAPQDDWSEATDAAAEERVAPAAHTRPLTAADWPDADASEGAPVADDRPKPGDSSLRQRLAALRARSAAEAAPARVPMPEEPVAAERKPLDTADDFAKAMLAQFEEDNWLDGDQDAAAPVPEDAPAVDFGAGDDTFSPESAVDDEHVETWAVGDDGAQDVSNESLLAALDAHLAATDIRDAAPESADIDDATAWTPADDTPHAIDDTDAAADRRLALETASRAEDIAALTGSRIDELVDRMGRLEGQDLAGRFTALADRFGRIDARLDYLSAPAPAPAVDLAPVTAPIAAIEARLARLEATATDQHAALTAALASVADRVELLPEVAQRLAAIEHHVQELSRRVETHEVNLRAMKALANALDRLEARLAAPRAPAPAATVPPAPRHPAADTPPRAAVRAPASAPVAPGQSPSQGHAMSEREAILERYRRQSRVRSES